MKISLLLGATFLLTGIVHSQIIIDEGTVVGTFEIVRQAHDTMPTALTIGNTGTGQNYSFTSVGEQYEDTMTFTSPSMLPGYGTFPASNLGIKMPDEDSTYIFLKKNSTGLYWLGRSFYQGGQLMFMQVPSTIIQFPSQMGTGYSYNEQGKMGQAPFGFDPDGPGPHAMVDSVKIIRNIDESSTIDGMGTISTPLGAFNSIRQNIATINTDTTWQLTNGNWEVLSPTMELVTGFPAVQTDTVYKARWWTNEQNIRFPLMEVIHDNNGTVLEATWLKATPQAAIDEIENQIVKIYPNPAQDAIKVETVLSDVSFVIIMDMNGSIVKTENVINGVTEVNVVDLDNGIYFMQLLNDANEIIHDAKIAISK